MDALKTQVGGMHYKNKAIQPIEYSLANNLNFCEGCVVKYVTRWRDKGGLEDLKKAKHYLEFLIEAVENALEEAVDESWVLTPAGLAQLEPDNVKPVADGETATSIEKWAASLTQAHSDEESYPPNNTL